MNETRPRPMTEAALQAHVIHAAKQLGWLCYHPWISVHSTSGFPDLLLLRDGRLIVAELKRDGHDPTPAQLEWLGAFLMVGGCEVYTWHPAEWHDDTIIEVLR